MKYPRLILLMRLLALLLMPAIASCANVVEQRQAFLQAQKYLSEKNEDGFLNVSAGLVDYPLYPYLRYQWLKGRLADTNQVTAFLTIYKNTRYAPLLRAKWLDFLAEHKRWGEFFVNYEANENTADDCRFHWAQYQTGRQIQALTEAKRIWAAGKAPKDYCQPLFVELQNSQLLTPEAVWQRFETVLENKNLALAKSVMPLMTEKDKNDAEIWLMLHQHLQLIEDEKFWVEKNERTGRLFAHTIKQLLSVDPAKAMLIWDAKKANLSIEDKIAQEVERRFGMALLAEKDPRAYERLQKLSHPEEDARLAKVRAALLEQNWQHVSAALAGLTTSEQQQPQWQYWLARSLAQSGNNKESEAVFNTLAKNRSFYGFLAADTMKVPYQFSDHPLNVDERSLKALAEEEDFKACQEFTQVNLDVEARRQWYFAIKNLSKEKLQVAAKLAQQWQWDQIAITTLVKADSWDDLALRFPLYYRDAVQMQAEKQQIDTSLIYGLIRQESMLDKNAVSGVGARGLMQLMPKTAKTVAHELHETPVSDNELFNPDINIRYGSYYFRKLLDRFTGHTAVASAAYNAGPSRVQKWLPMAASVPADIWVDTIPYKETRKYVSSVLTYAIIYQFRLKTNKLKLKDLLADIRPELKLS